MYLDAMEFLEEERDAWAPYEALAALDDDRLATPVEAAHGWSGRDLMAHLLAWQSVALEAAIELAVDERSPRIERADAEWEARGGEVINEELTADWADRPMDELRQKFTTVPGELRGYLTVVPESRWLKHADHQAWFRDETIAHYEEHAEDLRAILDAATR
ncbi:MAG TPA: ClbS/DfsB family four-helix bundle protein [Candidatus Saccharimonadales bacterium]|nr:ClbS/DfsB family four-helix bundle protein [Candidatus Saccharimonadales bacterium]